MNTNQLHTVAKLEQSAIFRTHCMETWIVPTCRSNCGKQMLNYSLPVVLNNLESAKIDMLTCSNKNLHSHFWIKLSFFFLYDKVVVAFKGLLVVCEFFFFNFSKCLWALRLITFSLCTCSEDSHNLIPCSLEVCFSTRPNVEAGKPLHSGTLQQGSVVCPNVLPKGEMGGTVIGRRNFDPTPIDDVYRCVSRQGMTLDAYIFIQIFASFSQQLQLQRRPLP